MKVAIIGAFGLVGEKLTELLNQDTRVSHMTLIGSKHREELDLQLNKSYDYTTLEKLEDISSYDVIFSAVDSTISHPWIMNNFDKVQCFIDKGSQFRLQSETPLAVPGIYSQPLSQHKIIASPNCVAIQFALALKPILDYIRHDFMVVTTMQSVSGSGKQAVDELNEQAETSSVYPFAICDNVMAQCGQFVGDMTDEEQKIIQETSKILSTPLRMEVTAVRVPVSRGHHMSVTCFLNDWHHNKEDIEHIWSQDKRVKVLSQGTVPKREHLIDSPYVFISRVRLTQRTLTFMISADNLYVGAAYNAWDIFNKRCTEMDIANAQVAI